MFINLDKYYVIFLKKKKFILKMIVYVMMLYEVLCCKKNIKVFDFFFMNMNECKINIFN